MSTLPTVTGNSFLAVDLSADERHELAAGLHAASPGPRIPGRRTKPQNWHVTLRFLGPIDDLTRDLLLAEVEQTLDVARAHVRISGLGAFPRPSKATVMYASVVDPGAALDALAAQCEDACREIGLEPEERPFVPHVTLARIRPPRDVRRLIEAFGEFSVRIAVNSVSLMRADHAGGDLRYVCDAEFPLS